MFKYLGFIIIIKFSIKANLTEFLLKMSKLLNISNEESSIQTQLQILARLRYKLSSQLRSHKQFTNMRIMCVRTRKLLTHLSKNITGYEAKDIDKFTLNQQMEMLNNLRNFIQAQGLMLKVFLQRGYLLQFTVIYFGCASKIYAELGKITKKLEVVHRVQQERKVKKNKKNKQNEKDSVKDPKLNENS